MKTHSFSCLDEDSSSDNGYYGTPSPENKRKRPKRKSTELLSFYIIRGGDPDLEISQGVGNGPSQNDSKSPSYKT